MINVKKQYEEFWHDYFAWLCRIIDDKRFMDIWDHYDVLRQMHETPFVYSLEKDGNRVSDALVLRNRYMMERGHAFRDILESTPFANDAGASVLEVLVALAERLDDMTCDIEEPPKPGFWFKMFMENLTVFSTENFTNFSQKTSGKLQKWMSRQYDSYGNGNIFRLKKPVKGFNKIEIWYQMHIFLEQNIVNHGVLEA